MFEVFHEQTVSVPYPGAATGRGCERFGDDLRSVRDAVGYRVVEVRENHGDRCQAGLFGAVEQAGIEVEDEKWTHGHDVQSGVAGVEIHVERNTGNPFIEADGGLELVVLGKHPRQHAGTRESR